MKFFIIVNLLLVSLLHAQKTDKISIEYGKVVKNCVSPGGKKMWIAYKSFDLKPGKRDSTILNVRLPMVSTEVSEFNKGLENPNKLELKCFPFVNGAKVVGIEIGDPEITPIDQKMLQTVKIYSNLKSNNISNPGGKEFCIAMSATSNIPNKYVLTVPIRAKVKLGILPAVWAKCEIKNLSFVVKK